jgi:multidrug efflux pump subunit AcrA (membrane-fusion protein)
MTIKIPLYAFAALALAGLAGWGGSRFFRLASSPPAAKLPTTRVKRGDVVITVTARGELQGGNSEMLTAPMAGGGDMVITFLRNPGELVKEGDIVVKFDTTEQEFRLREAEADLSEAAEQVAKAAAESQAAEEESHFALLEAKAAVRLAELEVRRNELLSAIAARQNLLALEAARDRLRQIEQDLGNRKETSRAGIAIQEAARNKAKVKAETARRNIESMTLRAKSGGYVNVQQNTSGNFFTYGMQFPMLQIGDTVRAGMAVAQIPDSKNWEVTARIGELDRGHLAPGQKAEISVVAAAGKAFSGRIKTLGGVTGPPWDRHFDCRIALDNPSPELRAGMSARIVVTTAALKDALWVPSQALFESDGRMFVYVEGASGFVPHDVALVQRSESQVVLTGVPEGRMVALASPDQETKKATSSGGAMKALGK